MERMLVRILSRNVYVPVILVAGFFTLLLVPNAGASARSTAQSVPIAITVYGQADSFTTKDINYHQRHQSRWAERRQSVLAQGRRSGRPRRPLRGGHL